MFYAIGSAIIISYKKRKNLGGNHAKSRNNGGIRFFLDENNDMIKNEAAASMGSGLVRVFDGAGEGNRTPLFSLGS